MYENTPIDVISTTLADGSITPTWVRLEDDEQKLMTLKIKQVIGHQEKTLSGFPLIDYSCTVDFSTDPDIEIREHHLLLRYNVHLHRWKLSKVLY